jgi:nucleoside-diphosphate-sugar epimerase
MLLAKGHKVRALARREDGRAEALRQPGAEVIQGDLTDLTAMHRAIVGCSPIPTADVVLYWFTCSGTLKPADQDRQDRFQRGGIDPIGCHHSLGHRIGQ